MGKRKQEQRAVRRRARMLDKAQELKDAIAFFRMCCALAEREWPGLEVGKLFVHVTTAASIAFPYFSATLGAWHVKKIELKRVSRPFIGEAHLGYDAENRLLVIRLPESCPGETK